MTEGSSIFHARVRVPLDRFDLDVDYAAQHRVTGVFGVSGSGKTTFIEALAGLRKNATGFISCGGEVWLDSERGVRLPAHRRRIGFVPQDHLLFPNMNVRENLSFAKKRAEAGGADFGKVFANVVDVLEIGRLLDRRVTELSGGEKQRVAFGRALCSGPRLLLLDEPTASLDAKLRLRILPFLKRVRDAFDLPIVIVSHNPSELNALCDEIVALREGRVVASGRPMEVLMRPDLFGDVEGQGFRNVMACVVAGHEKGVSLARMGPAGRGPVIVIPAVDAAPGESAFADVAASEILLSRGRPEGLSARNIVPGRILSLKVMEKIVLVEITPGGDAPVIVAEITPDAQAELAFRTGEEVFMVIKSGSFKAYSTRFE